MHTSVCVCVNDRTETIIPSRRAKMATTDYVCILCIYIYVYNISEHIVFLPSEHRRRKHNIARGFPTTTTTGERGMKTITQKIRGGGACTVHSPTFSFIRSTARSRYLKHSYRPTGHRAFPL